MSRTLLKFVIHVLAISSLLAPADLKAKFSNAIVESGLDHIQAESKSSKHGGAAAVDVNGDGYTDILVARDEMSPLLFINQGDGTFSEEASTRGFANVQNLGGFGAGDFDNDGDQDIFVTPRLGNRYYLFINNGDGIFSEEAQARGAAVETTIEPHRGYSVGIVDFDLDGYLDIYVSEWGVISNDDNAKHSVLLRNRGDREAAHFENVTEHAGLTQPNNNAMQFGFSSGWGDFDGDGWPDLALVSDFGTSLMYWNNGDGTFQETTEASNMGLDENGMGVAIVDYDQDGKLDIFVSSIYDRFSNSRDGTATGNKLYKNLGNRRFKETAIEAGVARTGWGWGASFFEYDNDGDPDLIVTNGSIVSAGTNPNTTPYVDAVDDPTTLLINQSDGSFVNGTVAAGLADRKLGKAIVVFDYEQDGDEDLFITNTGDHPILYQSDASENGNNYLRLTFEGTVANRDGYGCIVTLKTEGRTQTQLYNPSNTFIGQREPYLHFGLGAASLATVVQVTWPSGVMQTLTDISANQVLKVVEPFAEQTLPAVTTNPESGKYSVGDSLVLFAEGVGQPAPVIVWEKNGVVIEGETDWELRIKKLTPFDEGTYRAKVINLKGAIYSEEAEIEVSLDIGDKSIVRIWNEFLLDAIRKDYPDPTVHSRNLYHASSAMWDAFWAYEPGGWDRVIPAFVKEEVLLIEDEVERLEHQREAISHAVFTVLTARYSNSPGADASLFGFRWLMEELGYNPDDLSIVGDSSSSVGNRIGQSILEKGLLDGSNEEHGYVDTSGYESVNDPMFLELRGTNISDVNRWQPLGFEYLVLQNGIKIGESIQTFLGVNWRNVDTFAIRKTEEGLIDIDPGPPPQFGGETHQEFIDAVVEVIRYSSLLDPTDGENIDISPGAHLNNTLGSNNGEGRAINPVTGLPYSENIVRRADYGRILAEFWADGPSSETPPGHWNTLLNQVTEHPDFSYRFGGQGEALTKLEWEVRAYLTLNGAMHDAAIAAWTLKRKYDYSRPISMIRYLGALGQSSDESLPMYHADGIPLIDGLIELVTDESSAVGGRHEHLASNVGDIAIRSWSGEPDNYETQIGGVDWILAIDWFPYQRSTFVSPAFAAYVSGHSTFSRAGAEVLTLLTGSPFFPGGLGEYQFKKNDFLEFEVGPSEDLVLQWATYYDAADEAGESRLYGGIHVPADDWIGRELGARIGLESFLKVGEMMSDLRPERGLLNLSSRAAIGDGERVMISGFVIDGDDVQETLVRSVGPGLEDLGVGRFAFDPSFELHSMIDEVIVASNDNWSEGIRNGLVSTVSMELGAFPLLEGSYDAAELVDLSPGVFTAVASSDFDEGDVSLLEIYSKNLMNISTRAYVSSGEGSLIAGFYLEEAELAPLLIRAVGPSLSEHGVFEFLEDPILAVYRMFSDRDPELIAINDNWQNADTASLTEVSASYIGAASLLDGSKDAGLFLQLPAGLYTVVVYSNSGDGVALAEVYYLK